MPKDQKIRSPGWRVRAGITRWITWSWWCSGLDPPSSILGGEAFLARIYHAYKEMQSPAGSNIWNTTLLRTFTHVFTLDTPRDPRTWPWPDPRPVPPYIEDALGLGQTISAIGTTVFTGIRAYAEQHNIQIEGLPADPEAEIPPEQALHIIHNFLALQFPLLHPAAPGPAAAT